MHIVLINSVNNDDYILISRVKRFISVKWFSKASNVLRNTLLTKFSAGDVRSVSCDNM